MERSGALRMQLATRWPRAPPSLGASLRSGRVVADLGALSWVGRPVSSCRWCPDSSRPVKCPVRPLSSPGGPVPLGPGNVSARSRGSENVFLWILKAKPPAGGVGLGLLLPGFRPPRARPAAPQACAAVCPCAGEGHAPAARLLTGRSGAWTRWPQGPWCSHLRFPVGKPAWDRL